MATATLSKRPRTLDGVLASLHRALELMEAGAPARSEVAHAVAELEQGPVLVKVGRAAALLGVSSPDTVKNWARAGWFPGACLTVGGQWQFPLDEVLSLRAHREFQQARARGAAPAPEVDGDPFEIG